MNEAELRRVVVEAIAQVAPDVDTERIVPGADLAEQLDLDSMDLLGIVIALSERTGVEIPERDYPALTTLDGAVAYLLAAQGDQGAST